MPKADKSKVSQKQKPVHPLSRKAQVLSKQAAREQRVNLSHANTTIKNDVIAQKLIWFQQEVDEERKDFTKRDLIEYTKKYLRRFDDELDQIAIIKSVGNRQGLQHTARKSAIQLSIERDQQMLESSGLEVPDIINGNHLDNFRKWDGNLFAVQNIKFRKLFKKDFEEIHLEVTEKTTE
ncbi:translation machinery-associated protein 16-like [Mytilus californianus]|uniref:translation machinery-associated protein 16-like n=1 Tax=Mytilus californianus TaxID=6549 RepID=UPI0022480068|nr:translation machinery-associated protein 16-like [Mytilus californianus]XP_052069533.1 translation machinery-associated protein 16-like [Mytilus californianus]